MTDFITNDWFNRLRHFQQIFLGFSGGLDSTVLLHALKSYPDLATKLVVVHINHQLQSQSDEWQNWCFDTCKQWRLRFIAMKVVVNDKSNVEAAARKERYDAFKLLVGREDALVTAHHADDQVETFFLNLFRGAGIAGMACMPESQRFAKGIHLRPLLGITKQSLLQYAQLHKLIWMDDPSNADQRFQRNWLRCEWLFQLKQRLPNVYDNILRSINLLQEAHQTEQSNTSVLLQNCLETKNQLSVKPLLCLSKIEQNNVIRYWLKKNNLKTPTKTQLENLFDSVIEAKQDANPLWKLGNFAICRYRGSLFLLDHAALTASVRPLMWNNFPKPLLITEINRSLHASLVQESFNYKQVEIRFRQGGERFRWHGKTRLLKKLLQDWHIPPWQRDKLPLLFIDQELVAVANLAVSDPWKSIILPLKII